MTGRICAGIAVASPWLASVGVARAEGADATARTTDTTPVRRTAVVFVVSEASLGGGREGGRDSARTIAMQAIRAHVSDLPITLAIESWSDPTRDLAHAVAIATGFARKHDAVGAFWLEIDRRGDVLLYLAEPAGLRVLIRRVTPERAGHSALLEEVALITRSTILALLDGGQIGIEAASAVIPLEGQLEGDSHGDSPTVSAVPRRIPPPTPPREAESGPPSSRHRVTVALRATTVALTNAIWQAGGTISVTYRFADSWGIAGGYSLLSPIFVDTPSVSETLYRHPIEMYLTFHPPTKPWGVLGEVGVQGDWISRQSRAFVPEVATTPDQVRFTYGGIVRAGLTYAPLSRGTIFFLAGIDAIWRPHRYVVQAQPVQIVIAPQPIRPRFELGVALDF